LGVYLWSIFLVIRTGRNPENVEFIDILVLIGHVIFLELVIESTCSTELTFLGVSDFIHGHCIFSSIHSGDSAWLLTFIEILIHDLIYIVVKLQVNIIPVRINFVLTLYIEYITFGRLIETI
jgi:hypothetical protein